MIVKHTLEPFYNKNSEILILGTMPSLKSRELGFYYMHPQNRFWKLLGEVFHEEIQDKKEFLNKHHIALWDVCQSCDIQGSSDASIKKVVPNNILKIIKESKIKVIYTTGRKAFLLYNKLIYPKTHIKAHYLYSPSPLNCGISWSKFVENYQVINQQEKTIDFNKRERL